MRNSYFTSCQPNHQVCFGRGSSLSQAANGRAATQTLFMLLIWLGLTSLTASQTVLAQSQTFTYTGAPEIYTVPAGVTMIDVVAFGAQGRRSTSYGPDPGREGGKITATLSVTPGQVLTIYVGGDDGFNGGGAGGSGGGNGGGASDIRVGNGDLTDRVLVAGGGGGSYYYGGFGGGTTGGDAQNGFTNGTGGSQTAGGTGASSGSFGSGGNGGNSGGGGGGGYYGGGGGDNGGGGGGSSYADATLATCVVHTQGVNPGNGMLTISPTQPVGIVVQPVASVSVCPGGVATATVSATGSICTYQWYKDGTSLGAAQSTSALSLSNIQTADIGSYSVVVTGISNTVTSTVFNLVFAKQPTRLYVNAAATTPGDGLSWATAYTDLQSALTNPCSSSLTEIWVAGGLYKPTTGTDRAVSFAMLPGVAIYGGFAGTETTLASRTLTYPSGTTLSGDIGTVADNGDNSYHVINNPAGLTNTAILDGFVITGGNAVGQGNDELGGGIYNDHSDPLIQNCLFQQNRASSQGGAMFNDRSSPSLRNCIFRGNSTSNQGGAIFNYGFLGISSPTLINCSFQDNATAYFGGAMFSTNTSNGTTNPVLINCSFQGNTAYGGGAMHNEGNTPTLTNCVFWNNGNGSTFSNVYGAVITATYSLFDASVGDYTDGGNNKTTRVSPFASASSVALNTCSPALNAGSNTAYSTANGPAIDLAGQPRTFNNVIDMGAVELQSVPVAGPARLYVNAAATGANTGIDWQNAFTDLQSALTYYCTNNLSEIWVAKGTYKPTADFDQSISFAMLPGVAIYGGFKGINSETTLTSRVLTYPSSTTLSGDIGTAGDDNDNSVQLLYAPGSLTTTARLDGFVITKNNGPGNSSSEGAFVADGSPTVQNCLFVNNYSVLGGGMNIRSGGSPVVINCGFLGNRGQYSGGGVFSNGTPAFINCSFQDNSAAYGQGCINAASGQVSLTNCVFWGNGGFRYGTGTGRFIIQNNLLDQPLDPNYTTDNGGNRMISTSPFASPNSFELNSCSPAINAGDNTAYTTANGLGGTPSATDLAGLTRTFSGTIDMGAVEYQAAKAVGPARLYVNAAATAPGNGLTWNTAFPDLQQALTYFCPGNLAEIWVAGGVYKPTGTNDGSKFFAMLPNVAIYGGFAGGETSLSQRVLSYPGSSTLSGDVDNDGTLAGNSNRVIFNENLTGSAILDGFVITGGNPEKFGGGMYNGNSSPTIKNCLFTNNAGVAMVNSDSNPNLTNCTFANNPNGAMSNFGSSPTLINCAFVSNTGPAMSNNAYESESSPKLINCSFLTNTGGFAFSSYANGGGTSSPTLTNCSFQGNTDGAMNSIAGASQIGVGICQPVLVNCVFWNNGGAGSFQNTSTQASASYCLFDVAVTGYIDNGNNKTTRISPFVSTTSVQLNDCSVAINVGSNAAYTAASSVTTDVAGNARTFGSTIDIGAAEFQGAKAVGPARLYVNASATAPGNGLTWATAFPDLQDALNYYCPDNLAEVWVAAGTYKPIAIFDLQGGQVKSFVIPAGLSVLGGFPATGNPTLAQRNPASFSTILSGDINTVGDANDNSFHVVVFTPGSATTTPAILDGAIITGGNANGAGRTGANIDDYGGGAIIFSDNGTNSPKLTNVTFLNNAGNGAGGLYTGAYDNANGVATGIVNPVLTNCMFTSNTSGSSGGGAYFDGGEAPTGSTHVTRITLNGCTFNNNTANVADNGGHGGAILFSLTAANLADGSLSMSACAFNNNTANDGGAIFGDYGLYSLVSSTFKNNSAVGSNSGYSDGGGAMYSDDNATGIVDKCLFDGNSTPNYEGGGFTFDGETAHPVKMTSCTFVNNSAKEYGGGLYVYDDGFTASNSIFKNNNTTSGDGGGVYVDYQSTFEGCSFIDNKSLGNYAGGGLYVNDENVTLINCLISGNEAAKGGGLYNSGNNNLKLINCTVVNNTAQQTGGIYTVYYTPNSTGNITLNNTIVWGNRATAGAANSKQVFNEPSAISYHQNSLVQDGFPTGSIDRGSNLTSNPMFVSLTDPQLMACSPAINAGDNALYNSATTSTTDLAGLPRIFNTVIDMGVYEYQASPAQSATIIAQPVAGSTVCAGALVTASVSVTGVGVFTYQWYRNDPINPGAVTPVASQTAATLRLTSAQVADAGSYSVVVLGGCSSLTSSAFSLTVNAFPAPMISPSAVTICAGTSTTLTASSGPSAAMPGMTYNWSSGQNTAAISVSETGTYSVTIAANGCSASTSAVVTVTPSTSIVSQPAAGSVVCIGTPVRAGVIVTGTGPFTYQWYQDGLLVGGQSTATLTRNSATIAHAGTYSVVVTGACGTVTSTAFNLTVINTLQAQIAVSPAVSICSGTSATLTASGGTNYLWSNGQTSAAISATATGNYAVTATTAGCSSVTSIAITVSPSLSITSQPSAWSLVCAGTTVRTGVLVAGAGPFTYQWYLNGLPLPNQTNATLTRNSATIAQSGTYSVVVGSTCGTVTSSAFNLTVVGSLTARITADPSLTICTGSSTTLTASGGMDYVWSNGQSGASILVTTAGPYSVTANSSGCTSVTSATVRVQPGSTITTQPAAGSLVCVGTAVRAGVLVGGAGPFSYQWYQNGLILPNQTTATLSRNGNNVGQSGAYWVVVTAGCGTITSSTFNLTVVAYPLPNVVPASSAICAGTSTTLTASGGSSYLWTGGQTTPSISASAAGTYSVTVTTSGCSSVTSAVLSVNPATAAVITPSATTICGGTSTMLSASGGNSYMWSSGETTPTISVSNTGTYSVTATNSSGCVSVTTASVTVNPVVTASIMPGNVTICTGSSATLTASGGITYNWTGGQTTASISVSAAGTYSVTATSLGCSSVASVSVVVSASASPFISPASTTICGGTSTTLTASGGSSYVWSNGQTTPMISVSTTGTYSVSVTASPGCSGTASASVTVNPVVQAVISPSSTTICGGTSTNLTASGGTSYLWSSGETTPGISVSATGTYSVTATTSGCSSVTSAMIMVRPVVQAVINPASITICTGSSTLLTASGGATYNWTGGQTTPSISVSTAGTYSVTATTSGCSSVTSAVVTVSASASPFISPASATICGGNSATLTASGGSSYIWSSGQTTPTISVSVTGTYSVSVTASPGCSGTASAVVTANPATVFTSQPPAQSVVCVGGSVSVGVQATGTGTLTYQWFKNTTASPIVGQTGPSLTLSNVQNSDAGSYFCVATGGCNAVTSNSFGLLLNAIYVTPSGAGTLDGSSWANAYPGTKLQNAINLAAALPAGCPTQMVWIAGGVYKPTQTTGPGSQSISFAMKNNVWIYGGFVGNETLLSQRPAINPTKPSSTTLSGEIGTASNSDNTIHVIYNQNLDGTGLLDGVVITGGNATQQPGDELFGGGVYNNARFGGNVNARFVGVWFTQNRAALGGGMGNNGFSGVVSVSLTACWFTNNTATRLGGGFYTDGSKNGQASGLLQSCTFWNNVAQQSPAMASVGSTDGTCSVSVINGSIINNLSVSNPSNVVVQATDNARTTIVNSIVRGNTAQYFNAAGDTPQPPVIRYSDIDFVNAGTTNVDIDPQFVGIGSGDLRLTASSPVINAGDAGSSTAVVGAEDGYGQARIVGGRVDMGAFEYGSPVSGCTGGVIASVKDGLWSDGATWSCGRVPALGERVLLNHAVTIPASYTAFGKTLVYGAGSRLIYGAGSTLRLGQ
jgi:hypothetical protein